MEIPLHRSDWRRRRSSPFFPQNFRSIPVATGGQTAPSQPLNPRSVVSIPVEFVQPDECSNQPKPKPKSDCAILIQKIWRGFRVRSNVKKIRDVWRQVEDAEKIILDVSAVEAIRRDERERLKLSERLMALLLRLDSIRGFDAAVKDLRKSVIRRAILFQEKVDSVGAVDGPIDGACESETIQEGEPVERELAVVKEEKNSSVVTLEKMMEENNRLMKLLKDVYDKSEMQSQILNSLCKRVGQLENAFACHKLCRRNKKQKRTRNSGSDVTNQ